MNGLKRPANRRSFIKKGLAAGAATAGASLLASPEEHSGELTKGDAAILRFLAAAEILESDLWAQYNELGGIQDSEVPGGSGNAPYTAALKVLDGDMDQYIHDNTEDEMTHFQFLNAYLASKGAEHGQPGSVSHSAGKPGAGVSADRTAHEPHSAHGRH